MTKLRQSEISLGGPIRINSADERQADIERSLEHLQLQAKAEAQAIIAEANVLLQEARNASQAFLEESKGQLEEYLEAGRQQGREEGYQQGYADGLTQAGADSAQMLADAQILVAGAYEAERRILQNIKHDAVTLITHVCKRILKNAWQQAPVEALVAMLDSAIESLYLKGRVKVVMNDHALRRITEFSAASPTVLTQLERFDLVPDPLIPDDAVYVISTDSAQSDLSKEICVDLTLNNQVDRLMAPVGDLLPLSETPSVESETPPAELDWVSVDAPENAKDETHE